MLSNTAMMVVRIPGSENTYTLTKVDGGYDMKQNGYSWGFKANSLVKQWLEDGTWQCVSALPAEFYFICSVTSIKDIYKATFKDGKYLVTWDWDERGKEGVDYEANIVAEHIKDKDWNITCAPTPTKLECNGFDAEGNPVNFTDADFKVGQRVTVEDGSELIVMPGTQPESKGRLVLVGSIGWLPTSIKDDPADEYNIVKVYDLPRYNNELLIPSIKGELIWQRYNVVAEKKKQLEADIKEAQEKVDKLTQEYNSL